MIKALRNYFNNRKYKRVLRKNKEQSTIYIDLGSTTVKMCFQNELISFKASVREVKDINLITPAMTNYVKVNENYYIIGEANKSNEVCSYKADRMHLDILILYGIKLLKSKGIKMGNNLKVNMLVPFTELKHKQLLSKKINGLYKVDRDKITLTLNRLFVEGESSAIYYKEQHKVEGNLIVCNIGGKTSDITIINSNNSIEKTLSINMGVQALLSEIVRYTQAPSSNILSSWLSDGYKFNKEELDHIKEANREFIKNIYNDLIANSIKLVNPNNSQILFAGGGALILKEAILEELSNYKIKILNRHETIYSDLLGAMILANETIEIINNNDNSENNEFTNTKEIEKKEIPEEVEIEVKKAKEAPAAAAAGKKTKYEIFIELFEAGLTNEEIMQQGNLAYQTLKNYKSKYKKEMALTY